MRWSAPGDEALPYELTTDPTDDDSDVWDFATPPGGLVDLAAAHLLTTPAWRPPGRSHPDGDWDVRRFRPRCWWPWPATTPARPSRRTPGSAGRSRCGEVGFEPFMPTPRCAMPTRAQPGLPRDLAIGRKLTDHHAINLGVYARSPGGHVRVGDGVTLA